MRRWRFFRGRWRGKTMLKTSVDKWGLAFTVAGLAFAVWTKDYTLGLSFVLIHFAPFAFKKLDEWLVSRRASK